MTVARSRLSYSQTTWGDRGGQRPIAASIHLSIYLSICLSIYLSVYLSICLSIYIWIRGPGALGRIGTHGETLNFTTICYTLASWACGPDWAPRAPHEVFWVAKVFPKWFKLESFHVWSDKELPNWSKLRLSWLGNSPGNQATITILKHET